MIKTDLQRLVLLDEGKTVLSNMRKGKDVVLRTEAKRLGKLVRIDRKSDFGNPFEIGKNKDGDRSTVISKYREWISGRPDLLHRLEELRGKCLDCWCHPLPCHGDILIELMETRKEELAND